MGWWQARVTTAVKRAFNVEDDNHEQMWPLPQTVSMDKMTPPACKRCKQTACKRCKQTVFKWFRLAAEIGKKDDSH